MGNHIVDAIAANINNVVGDVSYVRIESSAFLPNWRPDSEFINTQYIINNQKIWKTYRNETKYQLIDGAHRLAIAEFLEHEEVPVKIFESHSFEIPNYTDYIDIMEPDYRTRL